MKISLDKTKFIQNINNKLYLYSIKELTTLVVKLVILGFFLLLATYIITSKVTSYHQNKLSKEILPMTSSESDFGKRLVEYALIRDEILQNKKLTDQYESLNTLINETQEVLIYWHKFVVNDNKLLANKKIIDKRYDVLAYNIFNINELQNIKIKLNEKLQLFKKDIQLKLNNLIILKENLSGKVALMAVKSKGDKAELINKLFQVDLILGMKISEFATNLSLLLYVDTIEQFDDININQLTQNLKEVNKAIYTLQNITSSNQYFNKLEDLAENIKITIRKIKHSSIAPIIKETFEVETKLVEDSAKLKEELTLIYRNLKTISEVSNNKVGLAVEKIEHMTWVSTIVFVSLSLFFVSIFVVIILVIARKINHPIDLLNNTMRRLTHGDLSARLDIDDSISEEFSDLWIDFNIFAKNNQQTIQQQKIIFDNADIGIGWLKHGKYLKVNKKMLNIFGYTEKQILGQNSSRLYRYKADFIEVGRNGYEALGSGETFSAEYEMMRADGTFFWGKIIGRSIDNEGQKNSIWLFEDISKRKLADEKLYQLANFDSLTQLANRSLFNIYLDEAIVKAKGNNKKFALLFVDLDRFKHINDSLGHEAGDVVLSEVSMRMKSVLRESDILARLGGDEFTVILDDISDIHSVEAVAQKILDKLNHGINYKGKEVYTGCSIGISRYPENGNVRSELLSCADSAMYFSKKSGRNRFSFYSDDLRESTNNYVQLSQDLKRAVENNEFELHYQPKIDMQTREVIGSEALLRWRKPNEGLISPIDFIPVLEDMGLMVQVGEWVIFETCRAVKIWIDQGYEPGKVAINLSERQFGNNALLACFEQALKETGVPANKIEVEITESLMMSDSDLTMRILNGINELGIDIAMDDFGTGYSSLAYLKVFPIHILKIDRVFVRDITEDPNDAVIVEAIIAMAQQLKLTTVAEGIETEEQYEFLKARGCEIGQGYLFGKPVSFDEMLNQYKK